MQRTGKHKAVTLTYRITDAEERALDGHASWDRVEVTLLPEEAFANHDPALTFDGNHPLTGQSVTFHVQVLEMQDATPDEISAGRF